MITSISDTIEIIRFLPERSVGRVITTVVDATIQKGDKVTLRLDATIETGDDVSSSTSGGDNSAEQDNRPSSFPVSLDLPFSLDLMDDIEERVFSFYVGFLR